MYCRKFGARNSTNNCNGSIATMAKASPPLIGGENLCDVRDRWVDGVLQSINGGDNFTFGKAPVSKCLEEVLVCLLFTTSHDSCIYLLCVY